MSPSASPAAPSQRRAWLVAALVGIPITILLMSCSDRSRAANARLRDQVHNLEERNQQLKLRNEELLQHLASTEMELPVPVMAGDAAIPVVTAISIDNSSGRRQTPDSNGQRPLEVHVRAIDGRNRPVQLAGSMRIQVTRIEEGQPPVELHAIELTPAEVRDAWRGGLLGSPTWLISIPLAEEDLAADRQVLDVTVFYEDLRTGQSLECGDKVDIH